MTLTDPNPVFKVTAFLKSNISETARFTVLTCVRVTPLTECCIGSPDVLSDDGCDSDDVRRPYISLVVDELMVTERAYVKDLREVVSVSV